MKPASEPYYQYGERGLEAIAPECALLEKVLAANAEFFNEVKVRLTIFSGNVLQ